MVVKDLFLLFTSQNSQRSLTSLATHIPDDLVSLGSGHSRNEDVLQDFVEMRNVLLHDAEVVDGGLARWRG